MYLVSYMYESGVRYDITRTSQGAASMRPVWFSVERRSSRVPIGCICDESQRQQRAACCQRVYLLVPITSRYELLLHRCYCHVPLGMYEYSQLVCLMLQHTPARKIRTSIPMAPCSSRASIAADHRRRTEHVAAFPCTLCTNNGMLFP